MNNRYSGEDRRKFPRVKVSVIVIYRVNEPLEVRMMVGNKEVHAIMADLCEDGMSLVTNYNIPSAAILTTQFVLLNDKAIRKDERVKNIELKGEVRYNRFIKELAYQLGIKFVDIVESDRDFIKDFIRWAPKGKNGEYL